MPTARRPENTLVSFASALEVGAEIVEFDVQLTRDGHAVVLHDPAVDRTTDGTGRIREMTLAEVRRLSAGYPARFGEVYRGERIPTLSEVLGLIRDRAIGMIEIKHDSVTNDAEGGIEAHTVALAQRLQNGLLAQGYRLVTPPGTKTSIVAVRTAKAAELGTALSAARVDTTVREQEVRVSAALFNTEEDIDRILSVTHGRS